MSTSVTSRPARFVVLVYRVPPKPTANRVYVWRMLKKVGAVYLQQSVCVFPQNARVARDLQPILRRIEESSGEYHVLPLRRLPPEEEQKLIAQFVEQTARHYAEIIENCEVDFVKEIEFETFRQNFTYEEAEEIRSDYEKVCAWFARVRERDWFGAPNQEDARAWLDRCATLLEEFEGRVFEMQASEAGSPAPTARRRRRRPAGAVRPGTVPPAHEA